jgi:hypothetical protein
MQLLVAKSSAKHLPGGLDTSRRTIMSFGSNDPFFGYPRRPRQGRGFIGPPKPPSFGLPPVYVSLLDRGDFIGPFSVDQWKEEIKQQIKRHWEIYFDFKAKYDQFVENSGLPGFEFLGPFGEALPIEKYRRDAAELLRLYKDFILHLEADLLDTLG